MSPDVQDQHQGFFFFLSLSLSLSRSYRTQIYSSAVQHWGDTLEILTWFGKFVQLVVDARNLCHPYRISSVHRAMPLMVVFFSNWMAYEKDVRRVIVSLPGWPFDRLPNLLLHDFIYFFSRRLAGDWHYYTHHDTSVHFDSWLCRWPHCLCWHAEQMWRMMCMNVWWIMVVGAFNGIVGWGIKIGICFLIRYWG